MRDLAWIKKDNAEALARVKDGGPLYQEDPVTVVHEMKAKAARQISTLWRYIVITPEGDTQKNPVMAQDDLFRMFPEIAPNFFGNFGVVELTIRQGNGTQLILKKVR